ncbi:hypothetical protein NA56DRAFT_652055 [Hyaloscypha hepaticicola]|uniref:Uncharacterized protein n=1 Tax=Hyaloscypha hepaticicola TaxID=2082293 RepID=A0A2J6PGL8_9HELO|nr:hypothetical protein NA56DRAFT_652055 [Hyaloscypha hepaticicola]
MTPESYKAWKTKAQSMSSNEAASPVSWQTLFWTLIPLVTNVMTQPSGRVLSQPSRYRTYLRTSPIICFLDAFAFLIRVFSAPYFLHVPISRALNTTIRERYGDIKDEDASEGIQSLEKQTWLRWVFFVVGTLGPSIKLMAMQGVPWTKVWGALFLFAFLVIEAGALLGKKSSMSSAYSSLPAINGQATRTTSERQVLQGFETIETFTSWYGIMAHCAVFVWAFFDLWILRASAYDSVEKGIMASLVSLIFIVYLGNILICCAPLTVLALFFEFATYLRDHPPRSRVRKWLNRACIGGLLICAFGVISLGIYGIAEHRELPREGKVRLL